ncbi:hypothetical protein EUTSA_v10023726mg [Eutrema salsugineum]|uniref:J domain-containing protein n=1 Tax=Eutrema salsugineum TaxID=72664 RepID=V4MEN7_EUTSA|nr:hypothetical protein EUTSA_v10023726mg [Eutrema salsugineum]
MACEGGGGSNVRSSYYNVLGIRKDASVSDIRTAYRKLAMKWHPDRYARNPGVAGEAKRRFQQIQEAYAVLHDVNKRSMYDAGLYDPHDDDDEDFRDFMQEMISMMNNVKDEVCCILNFRLIITSRFNNYNYWLICRPKMFRPVTLVYTVYACNSRPVNSVFLRFP